MRPIFTVLCSVLGTCLLMVAPAGAQHVSGSIHIGAVVSTLAGGTDAEFEPQASLAGGVSLGYELGRNLMLQSSFLYLNKGAVADDAIDGTNVRLRTDLTYLDVPVLLVYRFPTRGDLRPRLFAGPFAGLRLEAHVRIRARGSDFEQTEELADARRLDYGAMAGGGVVFRAGGQRMLLEARGLWGLANIRDVDPAIHNRGVVFLLGLLF